MICKRTNHVCNGSMIFTVSSGAYLPNVIDRGAAGGVRTTIAKHHGQYSKSDHLCQDGVE